MAVTGVTPYGLLRVGGGSRRPPEADPAAAEAWWLGVSFGRWRPGTVALPPVMLPDDPVGWCAHGGLGPGPRNAAALARAALKALPEGSACPEVVIMVVAAPVAPHAWRVADGGVAVAPGCWVRRYAALPADARLGVWVHEIAHALLGWPDLPASPCLMGAGAGRDAARRPAPPGPALALAAGWMTVLPPDAAMPASAIGPGAAMLLEEAARRLLITRDGEEFAIHDADVPGAPLAVGRLAHPDAPLLAAVAGSLGRLRAAEAHEDCGAAGLLVR